MADEQKAVTTDLKPTVVSLSDPEPEGYVDPSEDLLNNEFSGDEPDGPAPTMDQMGDAIKKVAVDRDAALDTTMRAMLRIAESMEKSEARREAVRQLTYAEMIPTSPWNPEGKKVRLGFSRPTSMHGIPLNSLQHTEEEIALFNQLKPGRYVERKVEVQLGSGGEINIQWAGSKVDARIMMYTRFPTIVKLLETVIAERKAKEEARKRGDYTQDEIL